MLLALVVELSFFLHCVEGENLTLKTSAAV